MSNNCNPTIQYFLGNCISQINLLIIFGIGIFLLFLAWYFIYRDPHAPHDYWMQKADRHPGKYRESVYNRYGSEGFDSKGRIRNMVIENDIQNPPNRTIEKEAVLARTYNRYRP